MVRPGAETLARALLVVVLVASTLSAQSPATRGTNRQGNPEAGPDPIPRVDAAERERLARPVVGFEGGAITVADLEAILAEMSPIVRRRYRKPEALKALLDRQVRVELLAEEAERSGFGKHPKLVHSVKQNSVQLLIRKEFDERITPESVAAEDVAKYYEQHLAEFNREAMVRAGHIALEDPKRARELLKKVRSADMREFRKLAREHSTDAQTKLRGGDLNYFNAAGVPQGADKASIDPAIVGAAFKLKKIGDIAPRPVRTASGFSLVKLTGKRPGQKRTKEEVEASIRLRLWRQQRQQAIEEFVSQLKKDNEPKLHTASIELIRLEPETAGARGPASLSPAKPVPTHKPHSSAPARSRAPY
ncbi:MAG: peptidyl-prolyl cis-trans isomerase [Proteobacteria bacterium]|nr:peptidyl-prolyl cis-trans isomerase [Pseudomonadota bacterium]